MDEAAAGPPAFPWDEIVIECNEPRYKVEAIRFKARDESGFDWLGSDEVIVETVDAEGWTVSEQIGSVDSGDTHDFNPGRSCIVPVRPGVVVLGNSSNCIRSGQAAPLSFVVRLWEQDFFLETFCAPHDAQFHSGPHCPNPEPGADFIGLALIDLVPQDLEAALPNVGEEFTETVVLDPCPGGACAGAPDYSFTFRVTRLPDVRTDFLSTLGAAVRASGARSETEAIFAGLRSLRAPHPRRVESEEGSPPAAK